MNEEPSYDWFNRTKKYKLLCDKVIVLDNQLRSIKSHVDDLAEYFNCLNISEFSDTANWFSMAWAIRQSNMKKQNTSMIWTLTKLQMDIHKQHRN